MQEDSKKYTQDVPTTELSATERDKSIARITAELLQACDSAPKAAKNEPVSPKIAHQPEAKAPAKKGSVLEKEISSATPDKSIEVSQAIAQNLLQSDDGVRPFRQKDEKFKNFFTTTAVVLPKEMQQDEAVQEKPAAATGKKPSIFARLQDVFGHKPLLEEEEEEDDSLFFPEEVALERAFPNRPVVKQTSAAKQEPVDETLQFDLSFAQEITPSAVAPKPAAQKNEAIKGKVRFLQTETTPIVPEPVEAKAEPAPVVSKPTVAKAEPAAIPLEPVATESEPAPMVLEPVATKPTSVVQESNPKQAAPVAEKLNPAQEKPEEKAVEQADILAPILQTENTPETPDAAQHELEEISFEDFSEETAFLREACEVQTVRKETVITLAQAKLQGWKSALQAKYEAAKQQYLAAKAAKLAAEEAEIDAEVDEMMLELQGEDAPARDNAPQDTLAATPQEEGTQEINFFGEMDEVSQAVAPVAPDPLLASVHSAFAARGGQADVPVSVALAEESAVEQSVTEGAVATEPVSQAPSMAQAVTEEVTAEASVAAQDILAEPVAEEPALVDVTTVQEAVEELVAEESVDEAPSTQEAVVTAHIADGAPVQDPVLPSGVCLFDQAADEAAAEAQLGEITFVGAPAPAMHEVDPFVQDMRAPEDITLDWMPEQPAAVPSTPVPEEVPLLDDTLLADIAHSDAGEQPYIPPFEDILKEERVTEPLPEDPEGIQFGLTGMRVKLLVRTFTTAVFATGLFLLGLVAQGVLPAVGAIDPVSAPVPFLLVNLLLLLAAAGVSYPVFIEGVTGLWRKPSPDTLPAIACMAALLQLLLCLTLVDSYQPASVTLFCALAGIVLFADALGSLVMALVMQANFSLASAGIPHYLAYRVQGKDAQRTLTRGIEIDSPALLASRPVQQMEGFLEKSFSPRESDRRAQWVAYGLLGGAALAYLIALLKGQGALGAVSSFAAVLCIGAPFSVTLLAALPSLFLQRSAAKVGAVVPGWQSIESLGDINLLAVNASDLFPPLCAQLHGIKTFQKERVDLAILYATSMLMEGCDTLQNLFVGMVDNKQEILYPVKDLQHRKGLGFIGWCENYRVILGTRALMQAEGVPLPALDYENRYSKDGKRQVLYLSVSGQLYAMFIIGYRGEKSIARALRTLRKERIRLLVNCADPTLTAQRIEEIYRLPAGFITLLSEEQASVMQNATSYRPRAEGCLLHLGNFASLVGGLRAASGAAQAERAASAIQLVWAGFSILLCLFLCITGGLMEVALVAILLYQLAWSVLNLGVVFTKKFE